MFIEEYPGAIPLELCERLVARFEADPARKPSSINIAGYQTTSQVRQGTSVICDMSTDWKPLIDQVVPAMQKAVQAFARTYPAMANVIKEGLHCTGPMIERVDPGQGFHWHSDQTAQSPERVLTSLIYLRTIKDGGETEFLQQKRFIKPEAGKLALFPGAWTHLHRGIPPVHETKYVLSSFWIVNLTPRK